MSVSFQTSFRFDSRLKHFGWVQQLVSHSGVLFQKKNIGNLKIHTYLESTKKLNYNGEKETFAQDLIKIGSISMSWNNEFETEDFDRTNPNFGPNILWGLCSIRYTI